MLVAEKPLNPVKLLLQQTRNTINGTFSPIFVSAMKGYVLPNSKIQFQQFFIGKRSSFITTFLKLPFLFALPPIHNYYLLVFPFITFY